PDEHFILTSEGTIRWTGDAVGKLTAGEEVLRPRVRILADEQLTGPSREQVQARLDLWVKAHIDKVLGPLSSLAAAEDVTGIARGVAYRLIEDLGVLERQKVAEDLKGLEQNARASLRKYGVRFGAYHVYVPPLLKPAPRALATLLYAIKHDSGDTRGLDEVQQLASSGRTSIPANKDVAKNLYRIAGYRVAGERAVRVDILERLADLIRPALGWRDNAPGVKPPGALDGTGFTVTVGMTSLVGSSGEDCASILRSLGYRMERRPKPQETAPALAVAESGQTAETPESSADAVPLADDVVAETGMAAEPAPAAGEAVVAGTSQPDIAAEPIAASAGDEPERGPEADPMVEGEVSAPVIAAPDGLGTAEAVPEAATAPLLSDSDAPEAAGVSAEPIMIEVWRPGRFENREKRPHRRHQRRDQRSAQKLAAEAQTIPSETVAAPADAVAAPPQPQPRPHGPRPPRKDRGGRPRRHDSGADAPRHGKPDGRPPRQDQRPRPERREREPDPNSPFAKLAALKAQLEADSKERR
ncbi:MAG: helicase, partial [Variibacter sp.]